MAAALAFSRPPTRYGSRARTSAENHLEARNPVRRFCRRGGIFIEKPIPRSQETIRSGTAAKEPWKYYDLGHGYCTYDFFDQCPHRMACARCAFHEPKASAK